VVALVGHQAKHGRTLRNLQGSKAALPVHAALAAAVVVNAHSVLFLNTIPASNSQLATAAGAPGGGPPPGRDRHPRLPTRDRLLERVPGCQCTPQEAVRRLFAVRLKALREAGVCVETLVLVAPIAGALCGDGKELT
jgi:hypothetical protein